MSGILKKKIDKKILWLVLLIAALILFFYPKLCKQLPSATQLYGCRCIGYEKEESRIDMFGDATTVCYGIAIHKWAPQTGPI